MKKLLLALTMLFSLAIGTMTLAANVGDYYLNSNQSGMTKALYLPDTNITVLNYSQESIYVVIPNSTINYEVPSGLSRTISRDGYRGLTWLMLQDWNRITFFPTMEHPEQRVCRRAIVTVSGVPGNYYLNIDNRFC